MSILLSLMRQIPHWDRTSKGALALALILLVLIAILALAGPESLRSPATIGFFGLIITLQIIVMWGNRHMVTPFTQAQRFYLSGDFEAARDGLESWVALHKKRKRPVPVDSLVLLGNTYRSMGLLDDSLPLLNEANQRRPDYHYALFGLGRTQLARAEYAEASQYISRALQLGTPEVVRVDLALALYLAGEPAAALAELQVMTLSADEMNAEEPRHLMKAYLLFKFKVASPPNSSIIRSGLQFWESEAHRFSHTPYGQSLTGDIEAMKAWLSEA